MSGNAFELSVDVQDKMRRVCKQVDQDLTFDEFSNVITWVDELVSQGHNAESIACYLTLHTAISCNPIELKNALIQSGVVSE